MTCILFSVLSFEDYFKALFQEYWFASKIFLHLQMWLPNFRHSLAKTNPIAYMVCLLHNLVLETLTSIAENIDTPIRIDNLATSVARGQSALICASIDFDKHLP